MNYRERVKNIARWKELRSHSAGLAILALIPSFSACGGGVSVSPLTVTVSQDASHVYIQWSSIPNTTDYHVAVDDAPNFWQPIVSQTATGTQLTLDDFSAGFTPGVTYYVRVESAQTTFRLIVQPWSEPYLTLAYAREAWNTTGRYRQGLFSGVNWDSTVQDWVFDPNWPYANNLAGQKAYYLEHAGRAGLNLGAVTDDLALLDELARFYIAYEGRFTTLGAMRAQVSSTLDGSLLVGHGPDSTRTLIWIQPMPAPALPRIRECELCNSQFFHPVARLIRIITTLPALKRTTAMRNFVNYYGPLIIQEDLLRLLYDAPAEQIVARWQNIIAGTSQTHMSDLDAWLVAATAEILGANANEPTLVQISSTDQTRLQQAVQVGVQLFQTKEKTFYPDTVNFQGVVVGSTSYFNGDFNTHPDYAYSGYTGEAFPTSADAKVQLGASWDVSHFYRIPVFLRALYDNRKATSVNFPAAQDIQWLINQYVYKTFQGNFSLPLMNNFMEGSNGWYRVGYGGANTGYPPGQYCDSRGPLPSGYQYYCLEPGWVSGWGLVAFLNPDLMELEHSLLTLAWSTDPLRISFRERYFYYDMPYAPVDASGNAKYPSMLMWIMAGTAEKL